VTAGLRETQVGDGMVSQRELGRTPFAVGVPCALLALDLALAAGIEARVLDFSLALAAHLCVVGTVGWRLIQRPGPDHTFQALALSAILVGGPVSVLALGMTMILLARIPTKAPGNVLTRRTMPAFTQYKAEEIRSKIVNGRARRWGKTSIPSFHTVMAKGTLAHKQALLGLIGRQYHREYLPVLMAALRNHEASVRAQGAAVFAKLKEQHKARLPLLLSPNQNANPEASNEQLERVLKIIDCTDSGFIDAPEAGRARGAARELCDTAIATGSAEPAWELALCRLLLADGDNKSALDRLERSHHLELPEFRRLYTEALMRLGQLCDLHRLLATGHRGSGPSDEPIPTTVPALGNGGLHA
jgi:hypothetical protein